MAKSATPAIEDLFHQIEQAVLALESGDLPLEQALNRYESGLKAMKQARGLLDKYAKRLDDLREDGEADDEDEDDEA